MYRVASGSQYGLLLLSDLGLAEYLRNYVIPCRTRAGKNDWTTIKPLFSRQLARDIDSSMQQLHDRRLVTQYSLKHLYTTQPNLALPSRKRGGSCVKLFLIANAGAPILGTHLEQHIQCLVARLEKVSQKFNLLGRINQAKVLEFIVFEQAADDLKVLSSNKLIGHQNATHSMFVSYARLVSGRQSNAPGSSLYLSREQFWSHCRFSMRGQFRSISVYE